MHALLGLAFLGAAFKLSRGRSESFGEIPPPPDNDLFCPWARQAFGPVWDPDSNERFLRPTRVRSTESLRTAGGVTLPPRTLMEVDHVECSRGDRTATLYLRAETFEQLFTSASVVKHQIDVPIDAGHIPFDILDDNWGSLVVAPKKQAHHPSPSWQRQMRQSRSWKARRP